MKGFAIWYIDLFLIMITDNLLLPSRTPKRWGKARGTFTFKYPSKTFENPHLSSPLPKKSKKLKRPRFPSRFCVLP